MTTEEPFARWAGLVEALSEIAVETSQSSNLTGILDRSLQRTLELLEVDRGGIYLLDEPSGLLQIAAQCGMTDGFVEQINRLKMDEGFSGQVMQTGEPLVIKDITHDARLTRTGVIESGLRSMAVVPIRSRGKCLGTLFAITAGYREFGQHEVTLLTSIGNQFGVAIENARLLADTQNRLAQLAALQETGRAMVSTLNLDALLQLIIQQATTLLKAEGGMLNLVDWEKQEDEVVSCTGTAGETLGIKIPLGESLSGWVSMHNQPEITNCVQNDPRAYHGDRQVVFQKQPTNAAAAPLSIKNRVIGSLVVVDKLGGWAGFEQADLQLLVGFANQAAIAIENAQLYQKAQHLAVLEERNRLARELHDAVTQTLFSASLIAEAVPSVWEKDPDEGRALLQELRGLSRGALAEMRTLLLELRPAALVETCLEDLLRQLGEVASGREGIPVSVLVEGEGNLPPEVHVTMYRIAQEALNNVVKHARASHATVRLCTGCAEKDAAGADRGQSVLLSIMDDGRGFDLLQEPHHRLGLGIMQERADAIGATLFIDSQPGEGTQVTVLWEKAAGDLKRRE